MSLVYNRLYIDTNVLYDWLFDDDTSEEKHATSFIRNVQDGKYTGIVSDLALNELIKVIRSTMVRVKKPGLLNGMKKYNMRCNESSSCPTILKSSVLTSLFQLNTTVCSARYLMTHTIS